MEIKVLLQDAIRSAMGKAIAEGVFSAAQLPDVVLEVPPQKEFGDFATNFAMQSARFAKTSPKVIAQAIIDRLELPYLDKAVLAGPGFINFYLKHDWLYQALREILAARSHYGETNSGRGEKVQVEFVSANPTGPLHVGHGRGAAVGSALAAIMKAAGYEVSTEYYINDAGNQIDNLAASVNARYLELLGQPAEFPENGYHGQDIIATAQRIIDSEGPRYLLVAPSERLAVFKELALQEKLLALQDDLENFGVTFDVWFSERTLHDSGAVQKTCEYLKEKGDIYESGGALWLKSTAYGDDKDRVVIRDNGIPTYLASDIAYHRNKLERGFDKIINLWGADHHGYIPRVRAALEALGYDPERLEVLILQMVSLYRNGELVKMSKRTGQSVTLAELIEEVGRDAARYFFIMRSADSQLDFDLDLAKSHSNDNPVYYVQYAHARICSIFRQAEEAGLTIDEDGADFSTLTAEPELDLIRKMAAYPEEIAQAARERAPQHIAHFAYELAALFHAFYNQCRIIGTEPAAQNARLLLVRAVQYNLRHALQLMGITAPEKM